MVEGTAWDRIWDKAEYELSEGMNGQKVQSCIAMIEVPPAEAAEFFNKDMELVFGARMYESVDSSDYIELPEITIQYTIPEADFELEVFDD